MQEHHRFDAGQQVLLVIDAASRLSAVGAGAAALLGWSPARSDASLQELVHPGDSPRLMLALTHGAADGREQVLDLRIRGARGDWVSARCQLSPLEGQGSPRYAVAIRLASAEAEGTSERASRFEGHLWRIAMEVQAARIGGRASFGEAWWAVPEVAELSERQAEIVRRVVRGERVGEIALALNVTESTIRNHLSGIYQKFGVHSQSAFLSKLMRQLPDP
ncbi:MAG: hypothetical protein QOK42_715 [Frankiaceae bacterium]|jgi:DNA-binding CsgD family transcriptional regulator|nr:hypothetical protein [Frankiaceae bacterium]